MIILNNIKKSFDNNILFDNLNLKIQQGEFVTIYGPSGSGKTTLLNIIGMIEEFDEGELVINNNSISPNLKERKFIKSLRRESIGYLFQNFALIPDETIFENMKIPLEFEKIKETKLKELMKEKLKLVNLNKELNTKIYTLSGGEQQRVAIARLLLKNASIILADEPTGSLDYENTQDIINILKDLNEKENVTLIVVTHDRELERFSTKSINISKGEK